MNFQTLTRIETADFYLDQAFKHARESVQKTKQSFPGKKLALISKSRFIELEKIKACEKTLTRSLTHIITSFPSIDQLAPFYQALIKCTIDYDYLKQSLGAINWAVQRMHAIHAEHRTKLLKSKDITSMNRYRTMTFGRMASVIKQIKKNLEFLENSRRIMKEYPSIKTNLHTIVIAGFPNTGKTTLLKALTGSTPKIAPYPFTTQQLMIGYTEINDEKLQIIDTPGLLDREFTERNPIEKQAILALKHLAKTILFVIDPTETCGYTLKQQKNLLETIQQEFTIPLIILINKKDSASAEQASLARKEFKNALEISAEKNQGINDVYDVLNKYLNTTHPAQNA